MNGSGGLTIRWFALRDSPYAVQSGSDPAAEDWTEATSITATADGYFTCTNLPALPDALHLRVEGRAP